MIEVEALDAGYGSLKVLKRVSLRVGESELVTVVGANGAGKSTLLRCIQGLLPAKAGAVRFRGQDILPMRTEQIVQLGLTLVPEARELFPELSVSDNLALGSYVHRREADAVARRNEMLEQVFGLFPVLRERQAANAHTLSGGQQQMLAIGRALMARPRALMLDEPSQGLAPRMVREIFNALTSLRARGLAILLVEQNVRAALKLADRAYVLETGAVVISGRAADLVSNDAVMKAYLGSAKPAAATGSSQPAIVEHTPSN